MDNFDSDWQWNSRKATEAEIVTLSLPPQDPDSDIAMLEKPCADVNNNKKFLTTTSSDTQLEHLLSNFLKYGVLIASAVVLLGGILYLIRHGAEPADYHIFHGTASQFCSPKGVINAVLSGSSRGIIQLGLIILIAVPILRVVISLLTFLVLRNFTYVTVTSLVLAALVYSLVGAGLGFLNLSH